MATTVTAPNGAEFVYEEVKTARGTESLGEVPIIVWKDLQAAIDYYGAEGVLDMLDGTSLRVSAQNIARRLKAAGKTDDEIATAQVNFKPGKRAGGVSTPVSRARKAAENAATQLGDKAGAVTDLLDRIARGEIDLDSLLAGNAG